MSLSSVLVRRPKIFYGWWMVALGAVATSINKSAVNKGIPVFILPVQQYFGSSFATVSFIFALARSESGPTGPLAGWVVDRFGPRVMVIVGAVMSGGGFLIVGQTRSIWAFALVYLGVITIGSNIGFSYPMATLLNNWFYRRKGMAMSVFHAVDSIIPIMLVPLIFTAITTLGLDTTLTIIGIVLLSTITPMALFIRDTPESRGLGMDGDPPGFRPASASGIRRGKRVWVPPTDYGVKAAMSTPAYWILLLGTAFRLVAKAAVILLIIPILVSKGVAEHTAVYMFSLHLLMTVPMYLVIGWLADRFPKNWVLMATSVAGTASFVLLTTPLNSWAIIMAFVFLYSISEASAPTNWAALGEYFGRKTFTQLRGYVQFANFPGVLLAPVFMGWWFDVHGDYTVPLWIFTAVFGLSALTFAVMRRPLREMVEVGDEPVIVQSSTVQAD